MKRTRTYCYVITFSGMRAGEMTPYRRVERLLAPTKRDALAALRGAYKQIDKILNVVKVDVV